MQEITLCVCVCVCLVFKAEKRRLKKERQGIEYERKIERARHICLQNQVCFFVLLQGLGVSYHHFQSCLAN